MKAHQQHIGRGQVVFGGVDRRDIPRDRSVPCQHVAACPTCDAQIGEPCLTSAGKQVSPHGPRRRMALRAERKAGEYAIQDVTYARKVAPRTRVALRRDAGLTAEALADYLGVSTGTLRRFETVLLAPGGPEGAKYGRWLHERRHQ